MVYQTCTHHAKNTFKFRAPFVYLRVAKTQTLDSSSMSATNPNIRPIKWNRSLWPSRAIKIHKCCGHAEAAIFKRFCYEWSESYRRDLEESLLPRIFRPKHLIKLNGNCKQLAAAEFIPRIYFHRVIQESHHQHTQLKQKLSARIKKNICKIKQNKTQRSTEISIAT